MIIKEINTADKNTDGTAVSEIAAIDAAIFPANVWGREAYLKSAENDYDYLIAAVADTKEGQPVAGFALLRCFDDAELIRIAVDKEYRRQGLGLLLLDKLKKEAEGRGIHDIILEVRASNEPAEKMYEKAGFITEGIRRRYYSEPAEDAVIMRFKW